MKTRLVLLASYFVFTYIFVLVLIFFEIFLYHQNSSPTLSVNTNSQSTRILLASNEDTQIALEPREARVDILKEFFGRYDSPLEPYAEKIVDAADKYKLDYRLLPAIAMQESTLCLKAPKNTNNCWGFGIYGKKRTAFDSFDQAIEIISKTLAENYHGKGLVEPEQIMTKYTPSSDGSWAANVSYVMDRIAISTLN